MVWKRECFVGIIFNDTYSGFLPQISFTHMKTEQLGIDFFYKKGRHLKHELLWKQNGIAST